MTCPPPAGTASTPRRPQAHYRDLFWDRITDIAPRGVLDVGCGDGALVRRLIEAGIDTVGLEPAADALARLKTAGIPARQGVAETLPFDDNAVDLVVSAFTAHHLADLDAAMAEALRVGALGVAVLDQWYDPSIPSQRVARRFDDWCKAIDRATGMVHGPAPTAGDLIAALGPAAEQLDIAVETHVLLTPLPRQRVEDIATAAFPRVPSSADRRAELAAILSDADRDGITDDGAIILTALKR